MTAWDTGDATKKINTMAKSFRLKLVYTHHAQEQMDRRNLTIGDLLHVMKYGFVLEEPEPSTRKGFYKYSIEGRTPNSGSRKLKLIVIPDEEKCGIKFITVMWKDER